MAKQSISEILAIYVPTQLRFVKKTFNKFPYSKVIMFPLCK